MKIYPESTMKVEQLLRGSALTCSFGAKQPTEEMLARQKTVQRSPEAQVGLEQISPQVDRLPLREHLSKHGNVRLHPAGLLPLRIEVHCLALRPGVIVREGDAVTADGNRYNIGGDDPEFTRVDGEAVVVEDRLAIKP